MSDFLFDLLFKSRMQPYRDFFTKLLCKIEGLEKRIASLESKQSETAPDLHLIDFEGADATKVSTGKNESDIERLKEENK